MQVMIMQQIDPSEASDKHLLRLIWQLQSSRHNAVL